MNMFYESNLSLTTNVMYIYSDNNLVFKATPGSFSYVSCGPYDMHTVVSLYIM